MADTVNIPQTSTEKADDKARSEYSKAKTDFFKHKQSNIKKLKI